ncbi:MAG: alpha/beta hydrolase [Chloroflexota bacterium]|nr:alpha/beta hydrolase [Chloroflexota bacterium]
MATYVIVHGGWDGAWYWRPVALYLQAHGHEVYTATLTGSGERVHLATPTVGLTTHIDDIINILRYENLDQVILVGHSYGGMVITGVAERVPERLARLVYIDGFVPRDGQALADLLPPDAMAWFDKRAQTMGDGWRIPHDPPDADRRTDFLLAASREPLPISNPDASSLPRAYVACLESQAVPLFAHFKEAAARAQSAGWDYRELPTGHVPMETMPRELADLLISLA